MRRLAASGVVFISFQNGLGNEDILADAPGRDNVMGGLTYVAGARLTPGRIHYFDRVLSYIGEWTGNIADRAKKIATCFTAAGLETKACADIRMEIWKKLLGNMPMSAVSGLTNLTSTQILKRDDLRIVCNTALDEALSFAQFQGVPLERDEVVKRLDLMTAAGGTGDNKSSLCLDVLAKRQSEVDFIYGKTL